MASQKYLRIRNWRKHQKIAGNRAPYVTIQTSILLDMEYMCLPDRERLCFLLLIVFAGTSSNKIPADVCHIQHLCHFDDQPDISLLIKCGFLEDWDKTKHSEMLESNEKKLKDQRDRQKKHRDSKASHKNVTALSHVETETETETDIDKRKNKTIGQNEFDRWWAQYPKKVGKKPALAIWNRIKPDADILIADAVNRAENDSQWRDGFIPNPTTYLNQERWNDELQKRNGTGNGTLSPADEYAARVSRENEIISKINGGAVADNGETIPPDMDKEQWRDRQPGIPRLDG